MAPRLSVQTSIFGVVFFERPKKQKINNLTRKLQGHVRIVIYQKMPIKKTTKPTSGTFIVLRIPTAHDFRVISARTWACARTKRKRFPSNLA